MKIEPQPPGAVSPGQAVCTEDYSDEVAGFIWKYDEQTRVADILFFKPRRMDLRPHQELVAAIVDFDAEETFEKVLSTAHPGVKSWWIKAMHDYDRRTT